MYVSMTCPSDILHGDRQAHVQYGAGQAKTLQYCNNTEPK